MNSYLLFLLCVFSQIFSANCGHASSGDHVAITNCSSSTECLRNINHALIDVIKVNMDIDSSPCTNFWDYACGKWTAAPYYDHVDNFGAVSNFYAQQLQEVLTGRRPEVEAALPHVTDQLKAYYETCRKAGQYYLDLEKYINEDLLGGQLNISSLLDGNISKNFDWLSAVSHLRVNGIKGIFFEESVGFAFNDSLQYVIELKVPSSEEAPKNPHKLLKNILDFGWLNETDVTDHIMDMLQKVFELSGQLRELQAKHEEDEEKSLTLRDLFVAVPNIDWNGYFAKLMPRYDPQTRVEVESVAYLRDLADLLAHTEMNTLGWYILFEVCDFVRQIAPQITPNNCALHTSLMFPLAMNAIYDRWFYTQRPKDESALGEILENLRQTFRHYLQANKMRLNAQQIAYLQEKLAKMQLKIGNLPSKLSDAYLGQYYETVNMSRSDFFANHWQMLGFRVRQQHQLLAVARGKLNTETFYVNDDIDQLRSAPYFVHQRNLLVVPMLFVQMPFYHHTLAPVLQYSLMGWILGHELNHGFEMEGVTWDADGNESEMGEGIGQSSRFREAVDCLRKRRSASVQERVADVNGFRLAYGAYFTLAASQSQQPPLDEEFDAKQLFFLNFAQFFCGNLPRAVQHDRDDVRVLEVVRNAVQFAEAFHCPARKEGSCEMWSN